MAPKTMFVKKNLQPVSDSDQYLHKNGWSNLELCPPPLTGSPKCNINTVSFYCPLHTFDINK